MLNFKTIIITIVSLAAMGIAYNDFAHGGTKWDGGSDHHGRGWHHRGEYGPGSNDQMTGGDYKQLEQNRTAFFKETQALIASLYEKKRELQIESANSNGDAAKASAVQIEISDLRAQLDKKRIDHMVEIRELIPEVDGGFRRGGPKMGSGPIGVGYCRLTLEARLNNL